MLYSLLVRPHFDKFEDTKIRSYRNNEIHSLFDCNRICIFRLQQKIR